MTETSKAPASFKLGAMLAGAGVVLLVSLVVDFVRSLFGGSLPSGVIGVLDQVLLILMIVELLYTAQLSFREHVLVPEPFLLVALIAGVRRILVVTPELSRLVARGEMQFRLRAHPLGGGKLYEVIRTRQRQAPA